MKNGFVFIKLMVFFLIIAGISFGLYYFLKMPMLFYTCDGCIIIAAIFFIAWLFRLFFKKDIDRSLSSVDTKNGIVTTVERRIQQKQDSAQIAAKNIYKR